MAEELGFRTPAKKVESLRKRVDELEGVTTHVKDVLKLSIWLYWETFSDRVL